MMKKILPFISGLLLAGSGYSAVKTLKLDVSELAHQKGQHYEGWHIVDGKALSTGRFNVNDMGHVYSVNAMGQMVSKIGEGHSGVFNISKQSAKASLFILTIEPNNDTDPGPSAVHIVGGAYYDQVALATSDHETAVAHDFTMATGSAILAAPTGGMNNQGLWFFDPMAGQGSLDLPALPDGWVYEGWIVNTKNGGKLSTGLFRSASGIDSDAAGAFAGPLRLDFPPVPGQDIVGTAITLDDGIHAAVITVEPYPDFDPRPSSIKILKGDIEKGHSEGALELDNIAKPLEVKATIHS